MILSRQAKINLGILTGLVVIFPFLVIPAFMTFFFFNFTDPAADPETLQPAVRVALLAFYPAMMCFSLVHLAMALFYMVHQVRNKALNELTRALYVVGTFLMGPIVMPAYFILQVWPETPAETALEKAEEGYIPPE